MAERQSTVALRTELNRRGGVRDARQRQVDMLEAQQEQVERDSVDYSGVVDVLKHCGDTARSSVRGVVEPILSSAAQIVFPGTSVRIDFPERRGLYEADLIVDEGNGVVGDLTENMESGGLCDTISAAGLLAFVYHESPAKTIILDEKFKYIGRLAGRAASFLREASHRLGIQVIMVTHNEGFEENADTVYRVAGTGADPREVECVRMRQPTEAVTDLSGVL